MVRIKSAAVLVCLAVLAAGCGARLSSDELRTASGGVNAQGQAAGAGTGGDQSATGGDSTGAGATDGSATGGAAAGGTGGTGGATATGGGASGGGDAGAAAPAGGNGGATDVGVTPTEITLGNVSTLTGPVPGLFKGAVVGAQAFIAYQNSKGGVFGRKLKLAVGDDRFSADDNKAQIVSLTPKVFAFLGSFSIFDDSGAVEMEKSGVPDVGYSLSPKRQSLKNNYSPQPLPPGWRLGPLNYFKQTFGDKVTKKVGALIGNIDSAKRAWAGEKAAMQSVGYEFVHERNFQPTETDFTADVVQMKNKGVQMIVMTGDVTNFVAVAKSMAQQGMKVPLANWGGNAYDADFLTSGGAAVEGSIIDHQLSMYAGEDRGAVPEIDTYLTWLKKVDAGFSPDIFSAFSWASGRLFVQALTAAGPKATRAGLLGALGKIDNFDANGMLAPVGPATKRPSPCWMAMEVKGGKFVRKTPDKGFRCNDGGYFRLGG